MLAEEALTLAKGNESATILLAYAVIELANIMRSTPQHSHPGRHKAIEIAEDVLRAYGAIP